MGPWRGRAVCTELKPLLNTKLPMEPSIRCVSYKHKAYVVIEWKSSSQIQERFKRHAFMHQFPSVLVSHSRRLPIIRLGRLVCAEKREARWPLIKAGSTLPVQKPGLMHQSPHTPPACLQCESSDTLRIQATQVYYCSCVSPPG